MNIVHFLSKAIDINPLYDKALPLECLDWSGESALHRSKKFWEDVLPGQNHLIIDPAEVSVYFQMENEDDILSLPGANLVQSLFIYSAFILGMEWDPMTLIVPGNYEWASAESMGTILRHLKKDDIAQSVFIQFAHTQASPKEKLFIPGNTLHKNEYFKLISPEKTVSYYEWKDKQETDPSFTAYSFLPMYYFNAVHFQEYAQEWNQDYQDLFYLLSDAFKDGSASSSLLIEVILKLKEWNLIEISRLIQDVMILPVSEDFTAFYDLPSYMQSLETDEENNFLRGKGELIDCRDCIVINESSQDLRLENQSHKLILASQTKTRITSL